MQLILDIGNTVTKCAIYNKELQISLTYFSKIEIEAILSLGYEYQVSHFIVSSVVEIDGNFKEKLLENWQGIFLSSTTKLPIENRYSTPKTLGNDRLAAVVGAHTLFAKKNCLVIDAGTCIKYDFITKEGIYFGGAIAPGLAMRLHAMHNYTAKLPLLDVEFLKEMDAISMLGNSTENALYAGAGRGTILEMEGVIHYYYSNYEQLCVILTGGDASFFEKHLKSEIFARPNLIFEGLRAILNYNFN